MCETRTCQFCINNLKIALDAIVRKTPQTSDFTIHDATADEITAIEALIYKMRTDTKKEQKGFVGGLTPQGLKIEESDNVPCNCTSEETVDEFCPKSDAWHRAQARLRE